MHEPVTNQFNNYQAPQYAPIVLERNTQALHQVIKITEFFQSKPGMCLVPDKRTVQLRTAGGMRGTVSMRALVFHHMGHTLPDHGFQRPSCKNAGCVNPDHQVPVVISSEVGTVLAPKAN